MEWTNDKVIEFLEILQTEPCLWDPRNKGYNKRGSRNDAWRRVQDKLPFPSTVEELKKKKESLLGYYRIHLIKHKKSLKSGAGTNEIYTTDWFAFEIMDSFLRVIYDSIRTLNIKNEESEPQENHNLESRSETENNKIQEHNVAIIKTQTFSSTSSKSRKKKSNEDLPLETRAAQRQMDETFEYMKSKKHDEYEMFGRLIASKLKKIKNPNTCDILMNDIHNLVFRASMMDRIEHQTGVPASLDQTNQTFMSISQAPDLLTYLSPPNSTTSQSPHR